MIALSLVLFVVGLSDIACSGFADGRATRLVDLPWYDDRTPLALHLLVAAPLVVLGATGNAVVRSVLLLASDEPALERSQSKLRGGRFIGVLERWLIFGLALAGEPTAAALVISAKSIIRFPELSARSQAGDSNAGESPDDASSRRLDEADEITEYFLLGSLASWTLALAPAALVMAVVGRG